MIKVLKIASYLYARYYDDYKVDIDEMKLHKLLYFVQRESLVSLDKPAFSEAIQAWKFGPAVPVVHSKYAKGLINDQYRTADFGEFKPIIDRAKKAISDVAAEGGYTYILDSGTAAVLYSQDSDDIMPLVKKKLGLK